MEGSVSKEVQLVKAALAENTERASHWLDGYERPASRETLYSILEQYFWVNRAFVYGIIQFNARLAKLIDKEDEWFHEYISVSELEDVLATTAKIAADECMASDGHSGRNMHHNLLLRMGPRVGLSPDDARNTEQTRVTKALTEYFLHILASDTSPKVGLALVSAVEAVALPLMKQLREYFGSYVGEGGDGFTAHELEHLDLHIELEVHHAAESSEIYEKIRLDEEAVNLIVMTAQELEMIFGSFWKQFTPTPSVV